MNQDVRKEIGRTIFSIALTITFLVVMTWLWFGPRVKYATNGRLAATGLVGQDLMYYDLSEGINMENAFPVSDAYGLTTNPYVFQISNKGSKDWEYQIQMIREENDDEKDHILEYNYLRYAIKKNEEDFSTPANIPLDGIIYVDQLNGKESNVYSIKIWIDENAGNEIMDTSFTGKISVSPLVRQTISMK